MTTGTALAAAAAAALASAALLYNSLVRLKYRVRNAWSQIGVQLRRRHDLVPNLVETVRGYARHERETLEAVTRARTAALAAAGVGAVEATENALTLRLRPLLALAEGYPDLKASRHFLELQEELRTTENRIAFARQHYNDEVERLNSALQTVPRNVIARWFGFRPGEFLRLEDQRPGPPRAGTTG